MGQPIIITHLDDIGCTHPANIAMEELAGAVPGDINHVHPDDSAWRLAELRIFGGSEFAAWVQRQPVMLGGCRLDQP